MTCRHSPAAKPLPRRMQEEFTHYLPYIKDDDFLGVQNYTRTLYGPPGAAGRHRRAQN